MSDEILYDAGGIQALRVSAYPGGEPLVRFTDCGDVRAILLRPTSMQSLLAALFWVDALAARGREVPTLILPVVPGARQDRLNPDGDYLFTLKSVAAMINARNFPRVVVVDPHSDVTPALIDRCEVIPASACINPSGQWSAVISPDAGAEKRAGAVARKLGVPLVHAWKTRDVKTGAISGFGMEPVRPQRTEPPRMLVVDDMCDGGGTFVGLADVLDRAGVVADLWVTHGMFSKGAGPLLARYRNVYCTDSVLGDKPGVTVNNICERLLKGESIT